MKKLLFSLTHLLAACPNDKNRDGLDPKNSKRNRQVHNDCSPRFGVCQSLWTMSICTWSIQDMD